MSGVVKRFMDVMRGKTNTVLEKLEKPEEQLTVFIEDLNRQMSSLQKAVAAAMADEKRLKMQLDDLHAKADSWEKKAIMALKEGDEGLAREALLQKEEYEGQVPPIREAWETQKAATSKLKQSLSVAKGKVEEAKRKYTLLVARYKTAEANKSLSEKLSPQADSSAMQMMDRLNDRILRIESETEASMDLMGDGSAADLEARFAQLEKKTRGDDALSKLKEKLAASEPAE